MTQETNNLTPLPEVPERGEEKGALYWMWYNSFGAIGRTLKKAWGSKWLRRLLYLAILIAFLLRSVWQPYVIVAREYSFVVFTLLLLLGTWWALKKIKFQKTAWAVLVLGVFGIGPYVYFGVQQYFALYFKYNETKWVSLEELPLTTKVTPQPLNSIAVLAAKKISESESIQVPDRVMDKGEIKFTLEISPYKPWGKMTEDIRQVFSVSAESAAPDFQDIENVCFPTGEGLLYWNNTLTVVKRRLDPWKFFNYFPEGVRYLRDDSGQLVQVVSMAKWSGILFPSIEFGGVYILKQCQDRTWKDTLARPFIGEGTFIAPKDINDYEFLRGQNLKPQKVHRFAAASFRFQDGFFGPFPGFAHEGDVRIPDLAGDLNPQPFVQYVEQLNKVEDNPGRKGLFAYFCLEPIFETRSGLSVSLFQPGDGDEEIYVYHHSRKGERLTGCSTIGDTVASTKKDYNWVGDASILTQGSSQRADEDLQSGEYVAEENRRRAAVVESRPHIRDIAGERRFFFLSTAVTLTKKGNLAGGEPELAITDPRNDRTVWVDPQGSIADWDRQIEEAFGRTYEQEKQKKASATPEAPPTEEGVEELPAEVPTQKTDGFLVKMIGKNKSFFIGKGYEKEQL